MRRRRLSMFSGTALFLAVAVTVSWAEAPADPSRSKSRAPGVSAPSGDGASPESATKLVREVVYNELHGHDSHGYWRYWIEKHKSTETQLADQVETPDGPLTRVELSNGRPLSMNARREEDQKIDELLSSPSEQARHRKEYAEDEHRIGRILALLPDAFVYEPAQREMLDKVECFHLKFKPNPDYPAHSIEARIFHAMTGDLWISAQYKRLVRLDGKLQANVDFGYGILGRLYQGGWFQLVRTQVNNGVVAGDWKTARLEVHMQGRAMLFKTIARETSEVRGGFTAVPSGLSLAQAAEMMHKSALAPRAQAVSLTR